MKLAIGWAIGIFYVFVTSLAIRQSRAGWADGHADLGLWWAVIAAFLGIAALGALIGTWIHTRRPPRASRT